MILLHVNYTNTILILSKPFLIGSSFSPDEYLLPYSCFLDLTEYKCNWRKTKTECNHVNNKLGAKYGANELFGSVNFTDCLKLARWEFFRNFIKCRIRLTKTLKELSPGCQNIAEVLILSMRKEILSVWSVKC